MKIVNSRPALVAALCAALFLIAVAPAGAANYCVGSVPDCTGSPQPDYSFDRDGLLAALAASNSNPGSDTIYVAQGTIELPSATTFTASSGQGLDVVGSGRGKTIFRSSQNSSIPLQFSFQTEQSTASGFSLEIYDSPSQVVALSLRAGLLTDFEVNDTGGSATNFRAISLRDGARAEHGSISVLSSSAVGIVAQNGSASAKDVEITGAGTGYGVNISTEGSISLTRLKIKGFSYGIQMDGGTLTIADSEINMGSASNTRGMSTFNSNNGEMPINVLAERLTIVGSGSNQKALWFGADSPGEDFVGVFKDLLIYGTGANFESGRCVGGGASITADFYQWAANVAPTATGGCSFGVGARYDLAANDPGFRNLAAGDLRLRGSSPLIDRGATDGSALLDLRGLDRQVDGDDDTVAAVDFGAYEYQRQAPTVSLTAEKSAPALLEAITFNAEASDSDGEELSYAWSVDGAPANGDTAQLTIGFVVAGPHTVAVEVTDENGQSTVESVQVEVAAPPADDPTEPQTPACPAVTYAKVKVSVKPKKAFKRAKSGFKLVKKARQPYFALKAGAAGSYTLKLSSVKGKKVTALAGSQKIKLKQGTNRIVFGGRWNKKKLRQGSYRVSVVPAVTDSCNAKVVFASLTLKLR